MQGFRLQEDRPEVRAWTDMIALRNIPINKKEVERLKQFETLREDELNSRKRQGSKKTIAPPSKKLGEAKPGALSQSQHVGAKPGTAQQLVKEESQD